ncbi:unnamed protein product [Caenorhabditis angaria]|uniref:Uncharacterized protein n=1 Tax=Caenorhabditis angaria TaxID=860376 RepID=A0A9P1N2D2_9PELO|nr:unnamed protein product [Caenorhabditis angaria]
MSWPTESDLESLDLIIDRMHPIPNFPYPMKTTRNEHFPSSKGDPWIGAYTKNGYWFKFSWGKRQHWDEIIPEAAYRSGFLKDSKSFEVYRNVLKPSAELKFLIAKNIREDVLGILEMAQFEEFVVLGTIFVVEDFRHVGIGKMMMNEVMKTNKDKDVAMNSISYLIPSAHKNYNLIPQICRKILRITLDSPQGFENLQNNLVGFTVKSKSTMSSEDFSNISIYSESMNHSKINWSAYPQIVAIFDEKTDDCCGVAVIQEIQNDEDILPDLFLGPVYANSEEIVEVLMNNCLKKYYNPEDDYDFDIDHEAIYRRTLDFFIFSENFNTPFYTNIIAKLNPKETKAKSQYFQTCSNFLLPSTTHTKIWALSDPNIFLT